jgi:hypothetical protein
VSTSSKLLYGIDEAVAPEELLIVSADVVEDLQTEAKAIAWVVNKTWEQLRTGVGSLSERVRSWVSEQLEWKLDNAWSDTMWDSDTELPERPAGWWPSDEDCMLPFDDQWAEWQSGPNGNGLPPEILALGVNFGSPVSSHSLTFFTTQQDEIRNVAESLGLELVRDDMAIMRCWPQVWMLGNPEYLQFVDYDDYADYADWVP